MNNHVWVTPSCTSWEKKGILGLRGIYKKAKVKEESGNRYVLGERHVDRFLGLVPQIFNWVTLFNASNIDDIYVSLDT